MSYDPAAISVLSIEPVWETPLLVFFSSADFTIPGVVGFAAFYDLHGRDRVLAPGTETVVALVRLCILADASEGVYPLEFVPDAPRPPFGDYLLHAGFGPTEADESALPVFQAGAVVISGRPLAGGGCKPDEFTRPLGDVPPEVNYSLRAPSFAQVGAEVEVDWAISTNVALTFYSASIDFDETKLRLLGVAVNDEWFSPSTLSVVEPGPSDVGIRIFADLSSYFPPGQDVRAATLRFEVLAGSSLEEARVEFVECVYREEIQEDWTCCPLESVDKVHRWATCNWVGTVFEDSPDPQLGSAQIKVAPAIGQGAAIRITSPDSIFIRGDADENRQLELTDAIFVLGHLFLGGRAPACADAADANDDGRLNVADPVTIVNYLFLGTCEVPAPGPLSPGPDPTPDSLGCRE